MTVVQGARDPAAAPRVAGDVRVARLDVTDPDDGPTGGFFRDGAPVPW